MLISDGTTFDKDSVVKNVTGYIWDYGGPAIKESDWESLGSPNGVGLFGGMKDNEYYEEICLTEEFLVRDENETEDIELSLTMNNKEFACECGCLKFKRLKYFNNKLRCNSCNIIYIGS